MTHPCEPGRQGLYDPQFEHDACGVGFVVDLQARATHAIVSQAIQVLVNLEHRGACGCEENTGDGAGILIQTPHKFFSREAERLKIRLPKPGEYGVGMVFLPKDPATRKEIEEIFEKIILEEGQWVLGWRDVPVNGKDLGPTALASVMPRSRAAAEAWANGINMVGAAVTADRYSHQKLRLRKASRSVLPGTAPAAEPLAAGARLSSKVAPTPTTSTPSANTRKASRHCSQPMALVASSGTTRVPAPMPALAIPAARPRRWVNQGCTQAMDGV